MTLFDQMVSELSAQSSAREDNVVHEVMQLRLGTDPAEIAQV